MSLSDVATPNELEITQEIKNLQIQGHGLKDNDAKSNKNITPASDGVPRKDFWENRDEFGQSWHAMRFREEISPVLQVLRVNKQINEEATPIFYGQPFRFTNQVGWIVLYHFVQCIGNEKAAMLKDITVCHPAWSDWPDMAYNATYRGGGEFGMVEDWLFQDPYSGGAKVIGPIIDHARILTAMPALDHLNLVLHYACDEDLWFEKDLVGVPIYRIATVKAPQAKLHVLHLASYSSHYRRELREYTMSEAEDYKYAHLSSNPRQIDHLLSALRQNGIDVIEQFYDQHRHYPASDGEECVNKGLCDYIWAETATYMGSSWYQQVPEDRLEEEKPVCPGTKERAMTYAILA